MPQATGHPEAGVNFAWSSPRVLKRAPRRIDTVCLVGVRESRGRRTADKAVLSSGCLLVQRLLDARRRKRRLAQPHTSRVEYCVSNSGHHRRGRGRCLAQRAFMTTINQEDIELWNISERKNRIARPV